MRNVVVLFSGGIDSTVCAEMARKSGALYSVLHVTYGQANAEMEMIATGGWCRGHRLMRPIAVLPIAAQELNTGVGAPGPRVVPGRNMALISVAVNYAASHGCDDVWIGCNADDAADYPDCREEFIRSVSALAEATAGVHVSAPLLGKTKAEVVELARTLRIDLAGTWSCYQGKPNGEPCGTCAACLLRARSGAS